MASDKNIILAFDLYGTLLSTRSIAQRLELHFGETQAESLATAWRRYQLEYTWRLNSMEQYEPFSSLTRRSLVHALKEISLSLSASEIDGLMKEYDCLSAFPDVLPALSELYKSSGFTAVVFSNGTSDMVSASIHQSPELSAFASIFKDIIVVEEVRKFKPHPAVYRMLANKMEKDNAMEEIWLISGNPFDIVGARNVGMSAVWVDRAGTGWVDGLVEGQRGEPTIIIRGLDELINAVQEHARR